MRVTGRALRSGGRRLGCIPFKHAAAHGEARDREAANAEKIHRSLAPAFHHQVPKSRNRPTHKGRADAHYDVA